MRRLFVSLGATMVAVTLLVAGCASQAAPAPAPTQAPAAPAKPAEPTKAAAPAAPTAAPTAVPAKKVDYPIKGRAITFIVPWAAGGSVDTQGRVLAPVLEKDLGVPVEVVNKAGAASQIGLTDLVRAKPDGHTMAIITIPTGLATYLDPDKKAVYGRKDFEPVVLQVLDPEVVGVKADSPFKTLKDMVDAAKANPEKVTVGNTGLLGDNHLATLQFQKMAGVKFAIVPFESYSPASAQLLGGHIDTILATAGNFTSAVKSGQMRLLGIMDKEESKFFPGVPTFRSQGFNIDFASSRGIVLPGGTPKEIVDALAAAIKKAMDTDEVKKKYDDMGLPVKYMNREQFTQFWTDMEAPTKELLEIGKAEAKK